jgi:secreted PhoX family phosphatase
MPSFGEVVRRRRQFLKAGAGAAALATLPAFAAQGTRPRLGFTPISVSHEDVLRVAPGYEARVLYRWGDPVGAAAGMPEFRLDASNSAADQALQAGMHHDGMHYFPLPLGSSNSVHGVLALNHEYLDQALLFPDGVKAWSAEKVAKSQHAVGVSVIEVLFQEGQWRLVKPSRYARRLTARTPCGVSGPAAGHALLRTAQDPQARSITGTYAGCAHGWTPWGTYLSCEENWHFQFAKRSASTPAQRRYGILSRDWSYGWAAFDERFDPERHPNEPNRFGWVVELDPYDPDSTPVKRTALGRFMHEGAACSIGNDRRLAFYMGDDDAFEYVYKFVTAKAYDPVTREANRNLLDDGTLYVARFNADGSGDWLALVHGHGPLTEANGFRDQADVLVHARLAADALGATRMDRPEWIIPHPKSRDIFCSLTNNVARGREGNEGANPANRRTSNVFGHILRWREAGDDVAAIRLQWDVFVEAGDPANTDPAKRGDIQGDIFGSPDGLWIDSMGALWVQTDAPSRPNMDYANMGNNQLLAVDPAARIFKRFLTGPRGCEITGFHTTPDNRTAFVNVQHPGEGGRTDPQNPRAISNWPDYAPNGRPRSSTVVIRRKDGGIIGS